MRLQEQERNMKEQGNTFVIFPHSLLIANRFLAQIANPYPSKFLGGLLGVEMDVNIIGAIWLPLLAPTIASETNKLKIVNI